MNIKVQGLLQALGVAVYCVLIGLFMGNAEKVFGRMNNFFGPILVLILFSSSALICGLIVFYNPYKLFFAENKKRAAMELVLYTAVFLFFLLILFLLLMLIFK